jgi:hypothetical protein
VEWNWQGKTEVFGEKPVPLSLCPPQIPHGLTWDRTQASVVSGRRLTTWAMTRLIWDISNVAILYHYQNTTWGMTFFSKGHNSKLIQPQDIWCSHSCVPQVSRRLVCIYQLTWRNIPDDLNIVFVLLRSLQQIKDCHKSSHTSKEMFFVTWMRVLYQPLWHYKFTSVIFPHLFRSLETFHVLHRRIMWLDLEVI